jgi:hypothetical protein
LIRAYHLQIVFVSDISRSTLDLKLTQLQQQRQTEIDNLIIQIATQRTELPAQFLVVSLRRPMIEAADRTIGVTQARGAYTQVLGINLKTSA